MDDLPGTRDDVRLVRVEQRQRETRPCADDPERGGQRENRAEHRELGDRERPTQERQRAVLDVRDAVADERFHVARDEHGVDARALELLDVLARRVDQLRDRELPRRHVRQQLEHPVER